MTHKKQPLYIKIYNDLISDIKNNIYKVNDKLPSEKDLSDQYNVSRITSKKALELLVENGYIYRISGKGSFVKQTSSPVIKACSSYKLVGLIIEDFADSFGTYMISGIEQACSNYGYTLVLKRSHGSQKLEEQAIQELLDLNVIGIIIMPVHGDNFNSLILKLSIEKFPLVILDRELKGIPANFVGTDNYTSAKNLTDYLFDLGHQNICFISPQPLSTSSLKERLEGFTYSHTTHNLLVTAKNLFTDITSTVPDINPDRNLYKEVNIISNYILDNPQITAFFAVEYNIALILYKAILNIGKKVPEDYSIVCFDGPVNHIGYYHFTHVRQNEFNIGLKSVDLLHNSILDPGKIEKCFLDSLIICGESTQFISKDSKL